MVQAFRSREHFERQPIDLSDSTWSGGDLCRSGRTSTTSTASALTINVELGAELGIHVERRHRLSVRYVRIWRQLCLPDERSERLSLQCTASLVFQIVGLASGYIISSTPISGLLRCPRQVSNCSGGTSDDPQYQVLFTLGTGTGNDNQTPLPAALPLFASGLGGLGYLGYRRTTKSRLARAA